MSECEGVSTLGGYLVAWGKEIRAQIKRWEHKFIKNQQGKLYSSSINVFYRYLKHNIYVIGVYSLNISTTVVLIAIGQMVLIHF